MTIFKDNKEFGPYLNDVNLIFSETERVLPCDNIKCIKVMQTSKLFDKAPILYDFTYKDKKLYVPVSFETNIKFEYSALHDIDNQHYLNDSIFNKYFWDNQLWFQFRPFRGHYYTQPVLRIHGLFIKYLNDYYRKKAINYVNTQFIKIILSWAYIYECPMENDLVDYIEMCQFGHKL